MTIFFPETMTSAKSVGKENPSAQIEKRFPVQFVNSNRQQGQKESALSPASGFNFSPEGNLILADDFNHRIQIYDPEFNLCASFGEEGNGPGQFRYPKGIGVDPAGNLYIADCWNHRVQKFDAKGNFLFSFGSCGEELGQLNEPYDILVLSCGKIIVVERYNHRIQFFTPEGQSLGWVGTRATVLEEQLACIFETPKHLISPPVFEFPTSIATDKEGNFYIADSGNHRIVKFDSEWKEIDAFGEKGSALGQFQYPVSVTISDNEFLYIADLNNDCIQVFTSTGQAIRSIHHGPGDGKISCPALTRIDPNGKLVVGLTFDTQILTFEIPQDSAQSIAEKLVEENPDPGSLFHLGQVQQKSGDLTSAQDSYRKALELITSENSFALGQNFHSKIIFALMKVSENVEKDFDSSLAWLVSDHGHSLKNIATTHQEWETAAIRHTQMLYAEQRLIQQDQNDLRNFNRDLFQAEQEDKTHFRKLRSQFYTYRQSAQRLGEFISLVANKPGLPESIVGKIGDFLSSHYLNLCEIIQQYLQARDNNEVEMLQTFGEMQEQVEKLDLFLILFNSNRRMMDMLKQFHFELRIIVGSFRITAQKFPEHPSVQKSLRSLFLQTPEAELLPKILIGYQEDLPHHTAMEHLIKEAMDMCHKLEIPDESQVKTLVPMQDMVPVPFDSEELDIGSILRTLLIDGAFLKNSDGNMICGNALLQLPTEEFQIEKWISQLKAILDNQDSFSEKSEELFQQLNAIASQKLELQNSLLQVPPQDRKSPINIENNITMVEYQISLLRRMVLTLELNEDQNLARLITGCTLLTMADNGPADSPTAQSFFKDLQSMHLKLDEKIHQGLNTRKSGFFETSRLNGELTELDASHEMKDINRSAEIRNLLMSNQITNEKIESNLNRHCKTANQLNQLFTIWRQSSFQNFAESPHNGELDFKFSFAVDGPFSGEAMRPQGLTHTSEGDLLVADYDQHRILRFDSSGLYQGHFGTWGNSPGCFKYPVCVQVDSKGFIYVSDERNRRVQKFSADGKFVFSIGDDNSPEQQLGAVFSVSVDAENQLWVADPDHNRIQIFAEDGHWRRTISGDAASLHQPVSVLCLPGGEVIVSDRSDSLLHRIDTDGKKLATIDKQGSTTGELYFLHSHPDHGIFGSDFWSQSFLRFDEDLKSATPWGRPGKRNGQFGRIGGISIFEGTLAVADYDNGRVQCFGIP